MGKDDIKLIVHCADIHIRTLKMHDEYREAFGKFYDKIIELTKPYKKEEVRIVIVGDLVHQKTNISNEQFMLVSEFLTNLSNIAPLIVVAGNHDLLENNKDRLDSITPIVHSLNLAGLDIKYYKETDCYLDNNIVWCNYSIFDNNNRPDIEKAKDRFGYDKTYIGLYHAPIVGAKTDIGYEFDDNHTQLEHFKGNDMVLLGDIHKRSLFYLIDKEDIDKALINKYVDNGWEISDENSTNNKVSVVKKVPIAYPSSLIQQNYGESVTNHGFLLWDVKSRTFTEHNIDTSFGFYQFKIDSLDDLDNDKEKHLNP